MIFISGIHGAGKSYFCESVKAAFGFDTYSASMLIAELKKAGFARDKLIHLILMKTSNTWCLLFKT